MPDVKTVVTREFYDKLVIAFRECPGNVSFAARRGMCDRRTAKRAWTHGWPNLSFSPIKSALEREEIDRQQDARRQVSALQDAAEAQKAAERQEAIEAKKQEQQMLKVARADVLAALVLSNELVSAMRYAVAAIKRDLEPKPGETAPQITPMAAMNLLARHATLVQKSVGAAEAIIQLSRLDRGQTTINVGVGPVEEDLSEEAIDAELAAIAEVLGSGRSTKMLPQGQRTGQGGLTR